MVSVILISKKANRIDNLTIVILITCAIPQGSDLGPLLFLLYIFNDCGNSSKMFTFHLFAVDSNLFYSDSKLRSLECVINEELININEWLCVNKLSLNIDKSHFVNLFFHLPPKKCNYHIKLYINNN